MVTYMMYKIMVMDRLTMAEYLNWKKTLPGLRLGAQLDKSRSTIEKIIKTEDMSQKMLPDDPNQKLGSRTKYTCQDL